MTQFIQPTPAVRLDPGAAFRGVGERPCGEDPGTVREFWQWAFSDLRDNTIRGILAEFLVGKALGVPLSVRQTWDDFDLTTADGVRVEVKSSAYLQSWEQKELSRIVFRHLRGRRWSARRGFETERTIRADVFVLCVQTARTHDAYDPLDVSQWRFWVVPGEVLRGTGNGSISLGVVGKIGVAVDYADLKTAVARAAGAR